MVVQSISEPYIKHYGVDWLTLTKHVQASYHDGEGMSQATWAESFAVLAQSDLNLPNGDLLVTNPVAHYEHCYIIKGCGAIINVPMDLIGQGIRIVLSGDTLKHIDEHESFIKNALEGGWKVTRIDWCIDIVNSGNTARQIHDIYSKLKAIGTETLSENFRTSNSDTHELGARTSAIWSKVYEKGRQNGTDEDWLRFETEFKEGYAMSVASVVAMGQHKAVCGILLERYKFMYGLKAYDVVEEFCIGTAKLELSSPRKETNTQKWLWGAVRTAFIKFARIYPTEARRWLADLQVTFIEVESGKSPHEIK